MAYMTNYLEKRLNPALLVPGVRSIVSLAMNYAPAQQLPEGEYQLAAYALGQDYHDLMKQRLRELAVNIGAPMELFRKGRNHNQPTKKKKQDGESSVIQHRFSNVTGLKRLVWDG